MQKIAEEVAALERRRPELEVCEDDIQACINMWVDCYRTGNKLLICGNGGSAADALHIVGELMKGFKDKRPLPAAEKLRLETLYGEAGQKLGANLQLAFPAMSLLGESSLISAFANDVNADYIFAQQVYGYGNKDDILLGISTSGNSSNVLNAAIAAKAKQMRVIAFTGESGGTLKETADVCVSVPEWETDKIQELHVPIYHAVCAAVERILFIEH